MINLTLTLHPKCSCFQILCYTFRLCQEEARVNEVEGCNFNQTSTKWTNHQMTKGRSTNQMISDNEARLKSCGLRPLTSQGGHFLNSGYPQFGRWTPKPPWPNATKYGNEGGSVNHRIQWFCSMKLFRKIISGWKCDGFKIIECTMK